MPSVSTVCDPAGVPTEPSAVKATLDSAVHEPDEVPIEIFENNILGKSADAAGPPVYGLVAPVNPQGEFDLVAVPGTLATALANIAGPSVPSVAALCDPAGKLSEPSAVEAPQIQQCVNLTKCPLKPLWTKLPGIHWMQSV